MHRQTKFVAKDPALLSFLAEEPFERGTHWALWRLTCLRSDLFAEAAEKLQPSLSDPDPAIRTFSALTLDIIDGEATGKNASRVADDTEELSLYSFDSGRLITTTVGALVSDPPAWCTDMEEQAA